VNDNSADRSAPDDLMESLGQLHQLRDSIFDQVGKVIVGQQDVLEQILVSMFSSGHALLVGVPGLAKTLLIRTLADSLKLDFSRIQFTPDLMPSDITGTEVIQQDPDSGNRQLRFVRGPVFANLILADEINRTPPKTQAALLEAMQEHQVTVGGTRHSLDQPFMVLATQRPIEQEGTYPLPEALLDRFMMQIMIRYPDEADELEIVKRTTSGLAQAVSETLTAEDILRMVQLVRQIPVADHVALFAIRLARLTRLSRDESGPPDFLPSSAADAFQQLHDYVHTYIRWGAGPRASQFMVLAGKARAALDGRSCVSMTDIRAVAKPVLRHRIRTNFQANSDNIGGDQIVDRLISFLDTIENNSGGIDNKLFGSASTG